MVRSWVGVLSKHPKKCSHVVAVWTKSFRDHWRACTRWRWCCSRVQQSAASMAGEPIGSPLVMSIRSAITKSSRAWRSKVAPAKPWLTQGCASQALADAMRKKSFPGFDGRAATMPRDHAGILEQSLERCFRISCLNEGGPTSIWDLVMWLPYFFFLIIRRPPRSTLFPSTTLFRSTWTRGLAWAVCGFAELLEFRRVLFRSDRKSTRLNSSHLVISYAVFCLKKN